MSQSWTRTLPEGDTITVTVDALGAAVSLQRVWGAREDFVVSLEDFEEEWAPWLTAPFDDAIDEMRDAIEHARSAADELDDREP